MGQQLLFSLLAFIPSLIFVPVSIYGNILLYKHKNDMFIQKRSSVVLFGLNISFISAMFTIPLMRFALLHISFIVAALLITLFLISWFSFLLFLNIRNWSIFYKYKFTYYMVQLQWQKVINPNIVELNETNFYLKNNSKYGNVSYITKLFAIIHTTECLLCLTGIILRLLFIDYNSIVLISMIMVVLSLAPLIIFYVYIICRTPSFNDYFSIHWELRMHAKISIILAIIFVGTNIISQFTDISMSSLIAAPLLSFIFFLMNTVSTFLLIHKNTANTHKPHKTDNDSHKINVDVDKILSNKKALHLFMVHLSTEYSIECLLSYIEFDQFQKYLKSKMEKSTLNEFEKSEKTSHIQHVRAPSNVPQSLIISSGNSEEYYNKKEMVQDRKLFDAKLKAHKLYDKYIRVGAELEINISASARKPIVHMLNDKEKLMNLDNVNIKDLIILFEKPKDLMLILLNYSFTRWKAKNEFAEVMKVLNKKGTSSNLFEPTPTVDSSEKQIGDL